MTVAVLTVVIVLLTLWRSAAPGPAAARSDATATGRPGGAQRRADTAPTAVPSPAPGTSLTGEQAAIQRFVDLGMPVYCGGPDEPYVALTFDDGPGPYTPYSLKLLRQAHANATFFLVGKLLGEPAFTGYPKAEATANAVGEHTWDHVSVAGLPPSGLDAQIGRTQDAVAKATGEPVTLFRPPYGATSPAVASYVKSHGMIQVLWTIDSGDSQAGTSADEVLSHIKRSLSPGDIILLHENRGNTRNALPRILDLLDQRGLQAVTVPQLLALDPPSRQQLRSHSCG